MPSWYEQKDGEWVYSCPEYAAWCFWMERERHWSCVVDYYAGAGGVGQNLYQMKVEGDAPTALRMTAALVVRARAENQKARRVGAASSGRSIRVE
jgi:hypothetical protein